MPGFALPSRAYDQTFRRCQTDARLTRKGKDYRLKTGGETITVDPRAAPVIEWILDGDFFVLRDLGDQFADHPSEALMGIVSQLVDLRVIAILR